MTRPRQTMPQAGRRAPQPGEIVALDGRSVGTARAWPDDVWTAWSLSGRGDVLTAAPPGVYPCPGKCDGSSSAECFICMNARCVRVGEGTLWAFDLTRMRWVPSSSAIFPLGAGP